MDWCYRWCIHSKFVTLEEKRGEGKCREGTSGPGDGVSMESCVWTTAQTYPRTAGCWREARGTDQSGESVLQEAHQHDQKGFRWKLQRKEGNKPKQICKTRKDAANTRTSARVLGSRMAGSR